MKLKIIAGPQVDANDGNSIGQLPDHRRVGKTADHGSSRLDKIMIGTAIEARSVACDGQVEAQLS